MLGCRLYIDTYVEIAQIRGYLRQQRTIKTYNFHIDKSTLILHKTEFRVLYIEYIRKHSYYRRMGPMTLARRGGGEVGHEGGMKQITTQLILKTVVVEYPIARYYINFVYNLPHILRPFVLSAW